MPSPLLGIWTWGVGSQSTVAPPSTGSSVWATQTNWVHSIRLYPHFVNIHHVEPGKTYSSDPAIETFKEEGE